jgi:glycosyltransferase involved in cell wall biosynthesis
MKKVLVIAFSDLENDPRVFRQIDYLRKHYRVTAVGWTSPELEGVEFYKIQPLLRSPLTRMRRAVEYKLRRYEKLYWSLYEYRPLLDILQRSKFDLILANDLDTLPFALKIANGAKILLDTHEYAPRHFADQITWRFFFQGFNEYLCGTYMKKCDEIITVSPGVAAEYKRNYGIDPIVITNAAEYVDLNPTPVDKKNIRMITHGVASPNRRLELMIRIMDYMDSRFHLDLMLLPVFPRYYRRLEKMAAKRGNVSMIPPVERKEIIPSTNEYDISLIVFKPYTVNFRYGLFNKFFESLQARLAIVTGPSPEPQVEIVNRYGCGIVVDSFEPEEIAARLNRLTAEEIEGYKKKSHLAASELTASKNMEQLGSIVERLIG